MSAESGFVSPTTVEHGSLRIDSTTESEEQIREGIGAPTVDEETSEAASKLGKKGGQAAAESRKAKPKEEKPEEAPEPEKEAKDSDEEPEEEKKTRREKRGDPKHDPRARVAQATAEAAQAKRERSEIAERVENEVRSLRAELASLKAPKAAEKPKSEDDDPEPQEDDFESYGEYTKAAARHAARQEWKALDVKRRESEARQSRDQAFRAVDDGFAEAIKKAGDGFMDSLSEDVQALRPIHWLDKGDKPTMRTYAATEIMRSEHKTALMRALSDDPKHFQAIDSLQTAMDVVRYMSKLEARLDAAPAGPASRPEVSQARPPATPVRGTPNADSGELDEDAPLRAFVQRFGARERSSRGR